MRKERRTPGITHFNDQIEYYRLEADYFFTIKATNAPVEKNQMEVPFHGKTTYYHK